MNKKIKKLITMIIACNMCFILVACGNKSSSDNETAQTSDTPTIESSDIQETETTPPTVTTIHVERDVEPSELVSALSASTINYNNMIMNLSISEPLTAFSTSDSEDDFEQVSDMLCASLSDGIVTMTSKTECWSTDAISYEYDANPYAPETWIYNDIATDQTYYSFDNENWYVEDTEEDTTNQLGHVNEEDLITPVTSLIPTTDGVEDLSVSTSDEYTVLSGTMTDAMYEQLETSQLSDDLDFTNDTTKSGVFSFYFSGSIDDGFTLESVTYQITCTDENGIEKDFVLNITCNPETGEMPDTVVENAVTENSGTLEGYTEYITSENKSVANDFLTGASDESQINILTNESVSDLMEEYLTSEETNE